MKESEKKETQVSDRTPAEEEFLNDCFKSSGRVHRRSPGLGQAPLRHINRIPEGKHSSNKKPGPA